MNVSGNEPLSTSIDKGGMHSSVSNVGSSLDTVPQTPIIRSEENVEQHEVMAFVDDTPKAAVDFAPIVDPTFSHDMTPSQELGDYLARPVDIFTYIWNQATFDRTAIDPWFDFLVHPAIKKKIDNYAFLQGQLHIKVMVNASPFYYGALLLAYQPLISFSKDISNNGADQSKPDVLFSQRPHLYVLPQTNQGGEMTLPFFYHRNWLDITSQAEVRNMGKLFIRPVVPLSNANGVTGETLRIKFYAWMTDVKLCGPTFKLSLQAPPVKEMKKKRGQKTAQNYNAPSSGANDEYGNGPVSGVASAVASFAGKLVDVPVIGPFAKATSIGSSAVSHIASLFGFTNVPVISDVQPFKDLPFHSLASSKIGEPVAKLTLDPKNELSIDPRTTGLGEGDELSIPYLVQRESLLTVVNWASSYNVDDLLFYSRVSPALWELTNVTGFPDSRVVYMLPMSWVAQMFAYWRGDIIFRIKCICTKYHKGRVRITWDPVLNIGLPANTSNETTSFNRIVDISPDLDMEVRCSYLQARHFLGVRKIAGTPTLNFSRSATSPADATGLDPDTNLDNGALSIRVVNDLSSPVLNSDVSFLIYVRGAENLEFTNPFSGFDLQLSHFKPQAGDVMWGQVGDSPIQTGADCDMPSEQYLVYSGEAVGSLRTLLRRSVNGVPVRFINPGTPVKILISTINQSHLPLTPGYDPKGPHTAAKQLAVGENVPYTFVRFTPFTWILPAFVGYRGSMIYHYNLDVNSKLSAQTLSVQVQRSVSAIPTNGAGQLAQLQVSGIDSDSRNVQARLIASSSFAGTGGQALTNTLTQSGLSISAPFYSPFRFASADPQFNAVGAVFDDSNSKRISLEFLTLPEFDSSSLVAVTLVKKYSIGTDFNAFFFLNVPEIYYYNVFPTAD